jgi:hypothetical protein
LRRAAVAGRAGRLEQGFGWILSENHVLGAEDDRAFDRVRQLAHVAWCDRAGSGIEKLL